MSKSTVERQSAASWLNEERLTHVLRHVAVLLFDPLGHLQAVLRRDGLTAVTQAPLDEGGDVAPS